ncbi:MAG: hypothetical protein LEGION0398_MBIBDBAK_00470 [Legionellaceae bacterium]
MKAQHLKRLVLGLIIILIGCDITLLFAAQTTSTDITSASTANNTVNNIPSNSVNPLQQEGLAPTSNSGILSLGSSQQAPNNLEPSSSAINNQISGQQQLQQLQAQQLQQLQQAQQTPLSAPSMPTLPQNGLQPLPNPNSPAEASMTTTAPLMPSTNSITEKTLPPLVEPSTLPSYYQSSVSDEAFNSAAQNALPMSPEQIRKLRTLFNNSQFAASAPPSVPARPVASSQVVRLEPGATPPVVRLGQGFVTSLVFLDATGAPWPIEAYDVGNPTAFNIQWNRTDNTLLIQSSSLYTYGNLAVRLKGLVTPVMLTLIPGQKAIDYRVDLRIQSIGPNATRSAVGNILPDGTNPELLNVLDGIPPSGSKAVKVAGGACQAWIHKEKLYVRTRLTILSPAWIGTMSSGDGMKAYEMQKTPMLLVSQDGKMVQLKVEGL